MSKNKYFDMLTETELKVLWEIIQAAYSSVNEKIPPVHGGPVVSNLKLEPTEKAALARLYRICYFSIFNREDRTIQRLVNKTAGAVLFFLVSLFTLPL